MKISAILTIIDNDFLYAEYCIIIGKMIKYKQIG